MEGTAEQDQIHSAFASILARLVESTPGALGAVFADDEGEAVDLFGEIDSFDLKLAAAHMGILVSRLSSMAQIRRTGRFSELLIVSQHRQMISRAMGLGYQITVVLEPVASFHKLSRALDVAQAEIQIEAGGVLG
jgi:hypothetical protein